MFRGGGQCRRLAWRSISWATSFWSWRQHSENRCWRDEPHRNSVSSIQLREKESEEAKWEERWREKGKLTAKSDVRRMD